MAPKVPLTKEEKKALVEAKKLEKEAKEAEEKRKLRRDELSREMAMQAARRGQVDANWREIMLKVKEPVFKQEIETMWHTFERVYDKKDHLINHLTKLIDIAEQQHQRRMGGFCDIIDTNIQKFFKDLKNLSKENDIRTAALLKWGEGHRNKLMEECTTAENHLQLLLFHAGKTHDDYTWNKRGENMVKEDEERNVYLDIRDNLRSFLENTYNTMWEAYKGVLRNYVQNTADNQKQVRRLRRKENIMADIIDSQAKKLEKSDMILDRLKKELALYESGSKQAEFRARRDRHRAAADKLKRRLQNGIATDQDRLATLVRASDEAVELLEAAHKKGVKILRLANLCRKFETQREKVLPFGTDIVPEREHSKTNLRKQQSDEDLVMTTMTTCTGLARLWDRMSKAELTRRALYREKMLLEQENNYIMEQLEERHAKGLAIEKLEGTEPYRCICGDKPPQVARPSAVEGAIEAAKYRKYY